MQQPERTVAWQAAVPTGGGKWRRLQQELCRCPGLNICCAALWVEHAGLGNPGSFFQFEFHYYFFSLCTLTKLEHQLMKLFCLKETAKAPPQSWAERNAPVLYRKDRREEQRHRAALLDVPMHTDIPLPGQANHAATLSAMFGYCHPPAMAAVAFVVSENPMGDSGEWSACVKLCTPLALARLGQCGLVLVHTALEDSAALAMRHWVLKLGMELVEMGGSIRKVWLLHLDGDHWDSTSLCWGLFKRCSSPWPKLSPLGAYPVTLDNFG